MKYTNVVKAVSLMTLCIGLANTTLTVDEVKNIIHDNSGKSFFQKGFFAVKNMTLGEKEFTAEDFHALKAGKEAMIGSPEMYATQLELIRSWEEKFVSQKNFQNEFDNAIQVFDEDFEAEEMESNISKVINCFRSIDNENRFDVTGTEMKDLRPYFSSKLNEKVESSVIRLLKSSNDPSKRRSIQNTLKKTVQKFSTLRQGTRNAALSVASEHDIDAIIARLENNEEVEDLDLVKIDLQFVADLGSKQYSQVFERLKTASSNGFLTEIEENAVQWISDIRGTEISDEQKLFLVEKLQRSLEELKSLETPNENLLQVVENFCFDLKEVKRVFRMKIFEECLVNGNWTEDKKDLMELVENLGENVPQSKVLVNAIKSVEDLRDNVIQMESDILLFADVEDVSTLLEQVKSILDTEEWLLRNEFDLPLSYFKEKSSEIKAWKTSLINTLKLKDVDSISREDSLNWISLFDLFKGEEELDAKLLSLSSNDSNLASTLIERIVTLRSESKEFEVECEKLESLEGRLEAKADRTAAENEALSSVKSFLDLLEKAKTVQSLIEAHDVNTPLSEQLSTLLEELNDIRFKVDCDKIKALQERITDAAAKAQTEEEKRKAEKEERERLEQEKKKLEQEVAKITEESIEALFASFKVETTKAKAAIDLQEALKTLAKAKAKKDVQEKIKKFFKENEIVSLVSEISESDVAKLIEQFEKKVKNGEASESENKLKEIKLQIEKEMKNELTESKDGKNLQSILDSVKQALNSNDNGKTEETIETLKVKFEKASLEEKKRILAEIEIKVAELEASQLEEGQKFVSVSKIEIAFEEWKTEEEKDKKEEKRAKVEKLISELEDKSSVKREWIFTVKDFGDLFVKVKTAINFKFADLSEFMLYAPTEAQRTAFFADGRKDYRSWRKQTICEAYCVEFGKSREFFFTANDFVTGIEDADAAAKQCYKSSSATFTFNFILIAFSLISSILINYSL